MCVCVCAPCCASSLRGDVWSNSYKWVCADGTSWRVIAGSFRRSDSSFILCRSPAKSRCAWLRVVGDEDLATALGAESSTPPWSDAVDDGRRFTQGCCLLLRGCLLWAVLGSGGRGGGCAPHVSGFLEAWKVSFDARVVVREGYPGSGARRCREEGELRLGLTSRGRGPGARAGLDWARRERRCPRVVVVFRCEGREPRVWSGRCRDRVRGAGVEHGVGGVHADA